MGSTMEDEKDAFYIVRKGDIIGVYRSLSECQGQAGSSVISLFIPFILFTVEVDVCIIRAYICFVLVSGITSCNECVQRIWLAKRSRGLVIFVWD